MMVPLIMKALVILRHAVFLLVLGSWISVVSLQELVLGHLVEILREFLQR